MDKISEYTGRTKLIGEVISTPEVIICRGTGCGFDVRVLNSRGSYDTYKVIITSGRKPWRLREGTKICAIGALRGNTLWADSFTEYRHGG